MRTDTLSHPVNMRVLQEIDVENSGSIYIYTAPAIRSELENMQRIRESPQVISDESLLNFITQHIERTAKQIPVFEANGEEKMIAIKKPPSPAPPPATGDGEVKSISYYTINPHDRIELRFNNRPVRFRKSYDRLTKVQTVHIPGRIKYEKGDRLELRLSVTYNEDTGNVNTQVVEWVLRF